MPEAVKKMPTSLAYRCSSSYWAWLNSRCRLCSPYVFPQECFEVYGLSRAFRLNLNSSSLFWNLAQSAPHSCNTQWEAFQWPVGFSDMLGCCMTALSLLTMWIDRAFKDSQRESDLRTVFSY
jgi:hypothetical protein